MKKVMLLVVSFIAINLNVQGQAIQDGGFDNCWETKTSSKGNYLDFKDNYFFTTLNSIYKLPTVMGNGPLTAIQVPTSDAYEGLYSLKLMSGNMTSPYGDVFLPGAMGTLDIDFGAMECILGNSFAFRPTAIKGWHKYIPVAGDSAAIEIWLQKKGTVLGRGKKVITNSVSDWSEFTVPVTYTSTDTPDTIIIVFASSAAYDFTNIETLMQCKGQVGSTLYLDEIELEYAPAGIKEMLTPEVQLSVYPNPAKEQITIQIGKETEGSVIIYDYLARKVGQYPISGTQVEIGIRDYANGSYLINVIENDKVITTNRFVKQ